MIRFKRDMKNATSIILEGSEKAIKKSCEKLFENIIKDTPVDTGQLKANWNATFDNPYKNKHIGKTDKSGANTILRMKQVLNGARLNEQKPKFNIFLTNNLDYAYRIEFGMWSTQAPYGMVRVNINRFENELEAQANKEKR